MELNSFTLPVNLFILLSVKKKDVKILHFLRNLGFLTDGLRRPHVSLQLQFYHNTMLGMGSFENFFF